MFCGLIQCYLPKTIVAYSCIKLITRPIMYVHVDKLDVDDDISVSELERAIKLPASRKAIEGSAIILVCYFNTSSCLNS